MAQDTRIERAPGSRQARRPAIVSSPLAPLALAGVVLAAVLCFWQFAFPRAPVDIAVPVPSDLARMDPQLQAYLQEKIRWVRQKPADSDRQATLAMAYAANGLWETARDVFRNVERLEPRQPLAPMYAAVATQELGELPEAVRQYRELTLRFPDFPQGFYRLGDGSLRLGDADQAEAAFRRLVILAPREWRGFAGLGEVWIRRGRHLEAVKELEKALQLAPDERIAHHLLGLAYRGLGHVLEAEAELSRGLNAEHYPMPDAWEASAAQHMKRLPDQFEMARKLSAAGNAGRAVELLQEALAFHPGDIAVMRHLADACVQAGQPQKARELLVQVVEKDGRNLSSLIALANACATLGMTEDALRYATLATELATNSAQAHLARANAFLAAERDAEALESLESARRWDPQNAQIRLTMGDVCLQNLDQPEQALEHYRAATQLDPAFLSAYVRIAEVEIERGRPGPAREAIKSIRKLSPTNAVLHALDSRLSEAEPKKETRD